ncbi:MAG: DUF4230 domain-containing protein [Methylophilaceae bacterium]
MDALIGLISGLVIGSFLAYIFIYKKKKTNGVTADSSTLMHNIEKVFKVALAEGTYSDIFDYKSEQSRFFNLFKTKKKALLISEARVLIGYDFAKVKLAIDEPNQRINILEFPSPEVLAIDPEYKFYDADSGIFNRLDKEDYSAMVNDAKSRIGQKALESELPRFAANQMKSLLTNIDDNTSWRIYYQAEDSTPLLVEEAELPYQTAILEAKNVDSD